MTDEELARIKQETIGATDTEYLAPSDVWGLILRLELAESVCRKGQSRTLPSSRGGAMTDLDPNICEQCGETEATDGEQLCERCQEVHELYARVETLRLRAEKAEAELARVNAEAAVMREVLHFIQEPMPKPYCGYCDDCDAAVAATRDALSSTSAGAGLLKRLEASEAVAEAASDAYGVVMTIANWKPEHFDTLYRVLEAWRSAKGETK